MLTIVVPKNTLWDEKNEEFIHIDHDTTLRLEHSLISLSKWESKWCKPFLTNEPKTNAEILDYIKCMTVTKNVPPEVYLCLTQKNYMDINNYIDSPMTATTLPEEKGTHINGEVVTSELVYYWMIALTIPFECQYWHLRRLLTLIRVCNIKNQPPKKSNRKDMVNKYAAMNAARKKQLHTKG